MNGDTIIRQRIAGRSVHAIAKARRVSVAEVNAAIDRFADCAITDKLRKHTGAPSSLGSTSSRRCSTSAPSKATSSAARW
jgi:hypothetical protein